MIDLILSAIAKGAQLFPNISGGKDSQAMVKVLLNNNLPIAGLIHADLGRIEWHESLPMCEKISRDINVPLHIIRRSDGKDLIDLWKRRMVQMRSEIWMACDVKTREEFEVPRPFWSSKAQRYCTSDMKRDPINVFYRNQKTNFIISCEGIRADESTDRSKKNPFTVNKRASNKFYHGMSAEQAINAYDQSKRLVLAWYPIFNFSTEDVWLTFDQTKETLAAARMEYKFTRVVPASWPFHPAYVYGNDRVSCVFCIMGCMNDLTVGAEHRPELLQELITMEIDGHATFKSDFSLTQLLTA